jgi:shikimate dehydrogenase
MTDRYAVIGNPIAHSKSPLIHTRFALSTGQDLEYTKLESTPEGFVAAVHAFRDGGGRGLNVTAPFKLQAFELGTDKRERARIAGAANGMKFEADGRIVVDNFDGVGLANDIERNLGMPLKGKRVLMLGAGGAARGALVEFLARGLTELVIANRTVVTAQALARQFAGHGRLTACGYADLAHESGFDLVLNGTSASLKAELPPVPVGVFANAALAYEMVYGRGLTPFLRLAQNAGAPRLADGVGMLVEQAAEAFAWWRGVRPDTRPVIDQLTVPLV